jgi:hypothetical protein
MRLWVSASILIAGWLGGLLVYVNYFSETDRTGGDLVKAAAWISFVLGTALAAVAAFRMLRGIRHSRS